MSDPLIITLEGSNPIHVDTSMEQDLLRVIVSEISNESLLVSVLMEQPAIPVTIIMEQEPLTVQYATFTQVGPPGADATSAWINYVVGYSVTPTLLETISTGDVYQYGYEDLTTLYRHIATDLSEDAFYSSFDGVTLAGLIATKRL